MLRQLITSFTTRSAARPQTQLQPAELEALLESVPEVARKLQIRQLRARTEVPRSVCSSLKDLCEL